MLIGYHEKIGQWYKDDMSAGRYVCLNTAMYALKVDGLGM